MATISKLTTEVFLTGRKTNYTNALKWLATIIILIGSSLIPFKFFLAGYTLFLVGELILLPIFIKARDNPLICLHSAFIFVNILGLIMLGLGYEH